MKRQSRRNWFVVLGLFVAVFLFTFLTQSYKNDDKVEAASLASFDPGYIISDYQMGNYNSMNEAAIQNFLKSKGNCNDTRTYLANQYTKYSYHIKNGHFVCLADETFGEGTAYGDQAPKGESAAHIIYRAAQDYKINPQVLIVLLQKEQGLITDSWPNNIQYRSATGYGCPDTAACSTKYYGFKNQVRNAAAMFRTVLNGGWTNYPLGNNYIQYNPNAACGGSVVNIRSLATSALYRYTPYQPNAGALAAGYGTASCGAYGNRNFYLYFQDWFGGIIATPKNEKVAEGVYYIQIAKNNTMVVDVSGGKSINGANIQLYTKNYSDAQKWKFVYNVSTDDYTILNLASNKALDVNEAKTEDGTNIQLWDSNKTCAQRWKVVRVFDDNVKLLSSCSYKAIDVSAGVTKDESNIQIWNDNSSDAQRWKLNPVDGINEGLYTIKSSINDKKVIDISGGSSNAKGGTNIQLWNENYSAAQQWYIKVTGDGYYTIKNLQSNKLIDVSGAGGANKTNIQIWDNNGTCAQKWRIMKVNNNYMFISACSLSVLDLDAANTRAGSNIQIYEANNSNAQKWILNPIKLLDNNEYVFYSSLSENKVMDLAGNNSNSGTNIQLYDHNGTTAQKWRIEYGDNGYYTIYNDASGKVLDVQAAGVKNGANVQIWDSNGTCAQKWLINKVEDYYIVSSACSDLVLDVAGANKNNGTSIWLYEPNGTNAQKWKLVSTKE